MAPLINCLTKIYCADISNVMVIRPIVTSSPRQSSNQVWEQFAHFDFSRTVEPPSLCFCLGKLQTINSALALSPWCKFRRKDDTRLVYAWPPINTWCFLAAPHMVAKTKHAALMSRYYDLAHSVIMNQFEACWTILVSVGICEFQERSRRQRP